MLQFRHQIRRGIKKTSCCTGCCSRHRSAKGHHDDIIDKTHHQLYASTANTLSSQQQQQQQQQQHQLQLEQALSTSNGSSSGGSTSSTGTCSSGSIDQSKVGIYHTANTNLINPAYVSHPPHGNVLLTRQQIDQQVDALAQLHHIEVSRILQERSCRAITPMSLPSVRGTPTTSFELYHSQLNPSRSEQPTPVIRHMAAHQQQQQQLFHNRTNSYTQATSQQPLHQPYQSPVPQIYNPIHSDGPVKRRYLQVHQPMSPPAQPPTQIFQHQKSGSCSSAISSQGSSSLVGPGAATYMQGPMAGGELTCSPNAFEMQQVHVRKQSSSSAGWLQALIIGFPLFQPF